MSLVTGTRLGSYEVVGSPGAVYYGAEGGQIMCRLRAGPAPCAPEYRSQC